MKNIVVIGGSSGIGLALIQNLEGENIVNISRTPCSVANVNNLTADVSNPAALEKALSRIEQIDVLVYCAGMSLAAPVEYVKTSDYRKLFDVNILGAIESIKLAMPKLANSEDGRIILLSSTGGVTPIAFDSFYSASKAGLIALGTALRLEAPNIKSTAVVIGGTQTQFSFKRKVYTDCGEYNEALKNASDSLIKMEQTGYTAETIARKIRNIIYAKNPPPTVTVGTKNKLVTWLYKILPWRLKLAVLRKTYNL